MVIKDQLSLANSLNRERLDLTTALNMVVRGVKIVSFVIEDTSDTMTAGEQADVSAEGIVYPPQMIDAIRTQLQARINAINAELADMGVTT